MTDIPTPIADWLAGSSDDLRTCAKNMAPFSADRAGYIWGQSAKGGQTVIANVRGWGYLTGGGHGALGLPEELAVNEQRRWGEMIAQALNAFANGDGSKHSMPPTQGE